MTTTLLALALRGKKDAVAARERARQAARLLQFEPADQALIAAGTFVIAYQALDQLNAATLHFHFEYGRLRIEAIGTPKGGADAKVLQLVKAAPNASLPAEEDLAWILDEISQPRQPDLFEEIHQQNQEILALVHALRQSQNELARMQGERSNPSAA